MKLFDTKICEYAVSVDLTFRFLYLFINYRLPDKAIVMQIKNLTLLKLADRKKVENATGYKIGSVPLIGLDLPCIFDNLLLNFDFIYGGSGDELYTLKVAPKDVKRLDKIYFSFD